MKHFQDNSIEETNDEYEGSMLFRHWLEDEDDYDGSMVFRHWNED